MHISLVINRFRIFLHWLLLRVRVVVSGSNAGDQNVAVDRNSQLRHFYLKVFVGGIWPLTFLWLRLRKHMYLSLAVLLVFLTSTFAVNVLALSATNDDWGIAHLAMYVVNVALLILVISVQNESEQHKAGLYALTFPAGFFLTILALDFCTSTISHIFSSFHLNIGHCPPTLTPFTEHTGHGIPGFFIMLGVFLLGVSLWLLTRPLQTIRVTLWNIGDPTSIGLDHHNGINYDADATNIAIRIDNDAFEQHLEQLRLILATNPMRIWTIPVELESGFQSPGSHTTRRKWLYRMARPLRKSIGMLPSFPWLRALRARIFSPLRNAKLMQPRSAVPLQVTPESDTLKLQLTAIARFSFQQYLLPRDASRETPLPTSRDPYQDKTQHDGEWGRVAKDLLVSLRLHSFQLFLYLTLLASMFLLVAYDTQIFQFHEDVKKHIIGPFLWAGFFLAWAIISLWLRSYQLQALKVWAGRFRGHPFFSDSPPIFYFRSDRPEEKAWEELVSEDFDVEVSNFGLDHARVVEFTHAALLLIAFEILEKLL